jgi:pyrroloquinoline quinone biosynthesis protein D
MTDDFLRRPKLIRNCRLSDSPNQKDMLMMPEGVMRLKGTGVDIVGLCDGRRTLKEIFHHLLNRYPKVSPSEIETDTMFFLNTLRQKRVLDFE